MSETMLCANCAATVVQQDAFCPQCGTAIAPQAPTILPPPNVPPGGPPVTQSIEFQKDPPAPPAPPHYGSSPQAAPYSGPRQTTAEGFLAGLFDFGFTAFITTKVIKFIYVVATALIVLSWLLWLYTAFAYSAGLGLLVLVLGPVVALFWLVLYRIMLELVMMIFRIGADVQAIREQHGSG